MSLPDRNNPYSFQAWLDKKRVNFFTSDEFLQECINLYVKEDREGLYGRLEEFSEKVSFLWNALAEESARLENRPFDRRLHCYVPLRICQFASIKRHSVESILVELQNAQFYSQ